MSGANTFFCPTLREAFERAGMRWPDKDMAPGSLVRFSTDEGKAGDQAGFCKVFPDGVGASFGCNRAGTKYVWQMRDSQYAVPSNTELTGRAHQVARGPAAIGRMLTSQGNTRPLQRPPPAYGAKASETGPEHSYIARKAITAYGARQDLVGSLVLPVFGPDGELQSVQRIGINGVKRFLKNAAMKSGRMIIGELENGKPIIIAEGWATACSIREATGEAVVVGFSGNNLAVVATDLRRKFPDSPLVIAGDLDAHGKGLEYAQAAADAGAPADILLPKFADGRAAGDWNDLASGRRDRRSTPATDHDDRGSLARIDVVPGAGFVEV
jgi:phage/plasmid primase-like uncharacterized protein